jgi:hypothetical protein
MAKENVVKEASNIVTSENAVEFYSNQLGLADDALETEAVTTEPEQVAEEQSEPKVEEETKETEKPKDKVVLRFDKVTKQLNEERARAADLERRLREYEDKVKPDEIVAPAPNPTDKPLPTQFDDAYEYAEALSEWKVEQAFKEREIADQRNKVAKDWSEKIEKAKADLPDFDDIVASSTVSVSDAVRDAILESDVGPQILYELASDDDYASKIANMPPIKALKEIGRLEARFEERKEAPKVEAKTVSASKAPAPINPLKGGKNVGTDVLIDTNGEFYGSYAQWKAARQSGKLR